MINWEELKHRHVIKKFRGILAQWFQTDIFFVDERGQVRNFDLLAKSQDLKNPLGAFLFGQEKGRELVFQHVAEMNERMLRGEKPSLAVQGPVGCEQVIVSRITVDQEFLGTVYAYCFVERPVAEAAREQARAMAAQLGLDAGRLDQAISGLKVLASEERKYFQELVDLVAQEIVAFHSEVSGLKRELETRYSYDSMIGKSKPMQELYGLLDKIKGSDSTVLVNGENGTGKELIARAIHYNSARKERQFVTVNCSAFNENLLDSELFGHVKGAFTGAIRDKKGLFEAADHGTLFLDEIGDMSPTMQVKLLRVLQEGTLTPVGGTEQRKVDVRVVAATNKDLKEMIELGTFREDLYYRINVINIVVPSLRDRKEDIPLLVGHFLERGCKEKAVDLKAFANRALEKIYDYPWPGNIRELENEVERVLVLSGDEGKIGVDLLSPRIRDWGGQSKVEGVRLSGKLKDAIVELEKTMIREGLRRTNWNKSRLAKELGISRAGLIMKVEKYGLDKRKIARQGAA